MDPFFWLFVGFVLAVVLFLTLRDQSTVIITQPQPQPTESGCASLVMGLVVVAMAFVGFVFLIGQ